MSFSKFFNQSAQTIRRMVGAVLLTFAWAGTAQAQLPDIQHYGNVEYVTGGFGLDESTALKAAMPDYPLALTFAARIGSKAAYVSQVQVVVRDQYDSTILNVESQGPFLLARLAPGTYQVHATYENQTQSRPVTVSDAKSSRMVFEWVSDDIKPAEQSVRQTVNPRPEFAPGSIPGLD